MKSATAWFLLLYLVFISKTCQHSHGRNTGRIFKREVKVNCKRHSRYRRPDGQCNNLNHPTWGSMESTLVRLLPAAYDDEVNSPRTKSTSGANLPSARNVSLKFHTPSSTRSDVTLMVMQWGQFLDHDITLTPGTTEIYGNRPECNCTSDYTDECFPIPLDNDEYFGGRECLEFARSTGVMELDQFGKEVRQQMNSITAFIDASNLYGSSEEELRKVRDSRGQLKDKAIGAKGKYLPEGEKVACIAGQEEYCFLAGDERVNEQPGLSAMHTIFMRQHNTIANYLWRNTKGSDEETVFQETRKIVEAIMQRITYSAFLPVVLSPVVMESYQLNDDSHRFHYDPNIRPDISNAFATAAFRFGHSLIPDGVTINNELLQFKNMFNSPTTILKSLDPLTSALISERSMGADGHFSHSVTRHLFQTEEGDGFDLVALNIQRGRDHGLPPYNSYREVCQLSKKTSIDELIGSNPNQDIREVYESINDVDLFTAGMIEPPDSNGGLLGPTFQCLIASQFKRLKIGDSFWYTNDHPTIGLTEDQIREIKKITLSKVICDNTENKQIQENAFLPESRSNPLRQCSDLPRIDLSKWADHKDVEARKSHFC